MIGLIIFIIAKLKEYIGGNYLNHEEYVLLIQRGPHYELRVTTMKF